MLAIGLFIVVLLNKRVQTRNSSTRQLLDDPFADHRLSISWAGLEDVVDT
jgi:hypothetical protein